MATDLLIVHTAGPASTGPNSPTIAVAEEARARGLNVETLELFEDAPRSLGFLYAQFHATGRARLPRLYGRAVAVKGVDAEAYVAWIARSAVLAADPVGAPSVRSADPDDDYLVALAMVERAVLVSGDAHLTVLADRLPVRIPADFLALLDGPRA